MYPEKTTILKDTCFPGGSTGKESACNVGDLGSDLWDGKIPWRRERLPTPVFWPGEFHGLYSPWGRKEMDTSLNEVLELVMDRKAWRAVIHGVAKSQTQLSD